MLCRTAGAWAAHTLLIAPCTTQINLVILIATTSICMPVGSGGSGSGTGTGTGGGGGGLLPSPGGGSGSGSPGGTLTPGGSGGAPSGGSIGKRLLQDESGGHGGEGDPVVDDVAQLDQADGAPSNETAPAEDQPAAAPPADSPSPDTEEKAANFAASSDDASTTADYAAYTAGATGIPWLSGPQLQEALVAQG